MPDRRVAPRADVDALPVNENAGPEFASIHPGMTDAYGHDGHMAILLAVAIVLSRLRDAVPSYSSRARSSHPVEPFA